MAPRNLGLFLPLASLGAMAAVVAVVTPGCFGRECEASYVEYGNNPGEGSFADKDTWQSNPQNGPWLDFPPARTYGMAVGDWVVQGREPSDELAYVSASPDPAHCDNSVPPVCDTMEDNWTVGSGNIVVFSYPRPGFIKVTNDTCAQFYLRLVLKAQPQLPTDDAGPGGPADAAQTVSIDASPGSADSAAGDGASE